MPLKTLNPSHKHQPPPKEVHFVSLEVQKRRNYREKVKFLRRPHLVIYHLTLLLLKLGWHSVTNHYVPLLVIAAAVASRIYFVNDTFTQYLEYEAIAEKVLIWIGLGFLSSFGMGFGLHTFVLFLAPAIYHMASVANATATDRSAEGLLRSAFVVWEQVWWWSLSWGLGTAIGELPPYFAARAASLAGKKLKEIEEMEGNLETGSSDSVLSRLQQEVIRRLDSFNFLHIMLFASIPNPLFDLAGLACGHTLKPFWVFFGATFVGKALIKSSIQTWFVILVHGFSDVIVKYLNVALNYLHIHFFNLEEIFDNYKKSLSHEGPDISLNSFRALFQTAELPGIKDLVILVIIILFFLTMIESAVQADLAEAEEEEVLHRAKSHTD